MVVGHPTLEFPPASGENPVPDEPIPREIAELLARIPTFRPPREGTR